MKKYINMRGACGIETICEYKDEEIKSIYHDLREYRLSDSYNQYYVSSRCTNEWRNK